MMCKYRNKIEALKVEPANLQTLNAQPPIELIISVLENLFFPKNKLIFSLSNISIKE